MKHASLFSGIGGFDLAASWMGWDNVFQVEINPFCLKVLAHHFPEVIRYADIRTFEGGQYHGTIDIISAGFPCQPFSLAGKRKGRTDDRYLWPATLRIITAIRPRWLILENVPGLLSILDPECVSEMEAETPQLFDSRAEPEKGTAFTSKRRRIIGTIIDQLRSAGYILPQLTDGTPIILCIPACATGAPHRRDRLWFVAHADDDGSHGAEVGSGNIAGSNLHQAWAQTIIQPPGCGGSPEATTPYSGSEWGESKNRRKRTQQGQEREQLWSKSGTTSASGPVTESEPHFRGFPEPDESPRGTSGDLQPWSWERPWQNFPTQPSICGRNDGFPPKLADIAFSKWRTESIRGFGNAIVPAVALKIFQALAASWRL